MKCMCAQTRPRFILSYERVFGGMEFEPMLTPREKSPLPENFPRGGSNPQRCGQRAQTLPTSYSSPLRLPSPATSPGFIQTSINTQKKMMTIPGLFHFFQSLLSGVFSGYLVSSPPSSVNGYSQQNKAKSNGISTLSNSI